MLTNPDIKDSFPNLMVLLGVTAVPGDGNMVTQRGTQQAQNMGPLITEESALVTMSSCIPFLKPFGQ